MLAVSDRYGYLRPERAYALASPRLLEEAFGARPGSRSASIVHLAAVGDADLVAASIAGLLEGTGAAVQSGSRLALDRVRNIDRDFLVFDAILALAAVVAGLGMLNTLLVRAHERRREIALYRALGMTGDELRRLLVREGIFLGLTAAVLALLLGIPASRIGLLALREVSGLDLVGPLPALWALVCGILCVGTAVIASLHPARRLGREEVAASLRYS